MDLAQSPSLAELVAPAVPLGAHCLSFGRHEPAARRYDRARIAALGLAVVRRPTGGRAVWHGSELTYAFAAPSEALGSLRETYLEIHQMIRGALGALGVPAELASARAAVSPGAGACFAAPAGGEVMVGDRKVAGSAQLREDGALLQHGSVLLEDDQDVVRQVTCGDAPPDGSAPVSRLVGRRVEWDEAAAALAAAAAERWGASFPEPAAPAAVLEAAEAHVPRFRSAAWTWEAAASG